jgi:hypothetical protein
MLIREEPLATGADVLADAARSMGDERLRGRACGLDANPHPNEFANLDSGHSHASHKIVIRQLRSF